jgi:hypothetical protein
MRFTFGLSDSLHGRIKRAVKLSDRYVSMAAWLVDAALEKLKKEERK